MSKDFWDILKNCEGFDWDDGNSEKNWNKHKVRNGEVEQLFFNYPLVVSKDERHSLKEQRFLALGITEDHRLLAVIFTVRKTKLIRVISARDMSKKERSAYGKQKIKEDS